LLLPPLLLLLLLPLPFSSSELKENKKKKKQTETIERKYLDPKVWERSEADGN
jgi:hypothetical protein